MHCYPDCQQILMNAYRTMEDVGISAQTWMVLMNAHVEKDINWMLMGLLVSVSELVMHVCDHYFHYCKKIKHTVMSYLDP